jgi:hypothetical protein
MVLLAVPPQKILAMVVREVAPQRMHVVGAALDVVQLDHETLSLHAPVVRLPPLGRPDPEKMQVLARRGASPVRETEGGKPKPAVSTRLAEATGMGTRIR